MNVAKSDKLVYRALKGGANICNFTCDIMEDTESVDSAGLTVYTPTIVASNVPCRLVETQTKQINPDFSASRENTFILHLIDCPLLLNSYYFTNFSQKDTRYPNGIYKVIETTKIKTTAISGNLRAYLIEGLKMVSKNA